MRESLEQALVHLVQNAIDASEPEVAGDHQCALPTGSPASSK